MNHFTYHSEQVHSLYNSGKGKTRRNIVDIQNGKGMKAVEEYTVDGKRISRKEKLLTDEEMRCISKHKFIPGLFKDCIKALEPSSSSKKRKSGKTKRRVRR
jgi:hypothetical protein